MRPDVTHTSRGNCALLAWLLWVFLPLANAPASGATLAASLEPTVIRLGESAQLSITLAGSTQLQAPALPDIPNLSVAYIGPSQQVSIVNGQMSATITHTYSVTPKQPGDFTIPAISANVGGDALSTAPVTLKVLKPDAPTAQSIQSGSEPAFLTLTLPKKEVYLGEVIVGELRLHIRSGIQNIEQFQTTTFPADAFTLGKLVQGRQTQTQAGNVAYTVIPLALTLRAIKTGDFTVGPVTASVVVELPSRNRRRDGFLDPFEFFNSGERRQVALVSEPAQIRVLPWPTNNVPPAFNGAVGSYSMTVSAGPTNVAVGDPVTLKVQISGRGALETVNLPDAARTGFKAYPPTSKIETTDPFGIQGTKTFEQVISPESADVKAVPPFTFAYLDPDARTYRALTQPAAALVVRPAGSAAVPNLVTRRNSSDDAPTTRDIVHIKARPGVLAQAAPPLPLQPWFWALQSFPFLAWLGVLAWSKRNEYLAKNPRLVRRRKLAVTLRDGAAQLQAHANNNNSEEFFAMLFRLLQEQIGEKLDLPASAITEAAIDERLPALGAPEALRQQLHELFQACNQARYAPVGTSQALTAFIPRWESASRELSNLRS